MFECNIDLIFNQINIKTRKEQGMEGGLHKHMFPISNKPRICPDKTNKLYKPVHKIHNIIKNIKPTKFPKGVVGGRNKNVNKREEDQKQIQRLSF